MMSFSILSKTKKLHKRHTTQSITPSTVIILQGESQIFHYVSGLAKGLQEICSKKISVAVPSLAVRPMFLYSMIYPPDTTQ